MAEDTSQKIELNDSIKIITAPDLIFDQSKRLLAIQPRQDLKQRIEDWALDQSQAVSIYYYTEMDTDLKWLLTTANLSSIILIDIDNCDKNVNRILSYLISLPHTYYRCDNMDVDWNLLNRNRFYDFPEF